MPHQSGNTQQRPSDGYPACRECETDVFVDQDTSRATYICHACGATFDTGRTA